MDFTLGMLGGQLGHAWCSIRAQRRAQPGHCTSLNLGSDSTTGRKTGGRRASGRQVAWWPFKGPQKNIFLRARARPDPIFGPYLGPYLGPHLGPYLGPIWAHIWAGALFGPGPYLGPTYAHIWSLIWPHIWALTWAHIWARAHGGPIFTYKNGPEANLTHMRAQNISTTSPGSKFRDLQVCQNPFGPKYGFQIGPILWPILGIIFWSILGPIWTHI